MTTVTRGFRSSTVTLIRLQDDRDVPWPTFRSAPSMHPDIAVAVIHYESPDTLKMTVQAVLDQSLKPKGVLVVDNASRDGSGRELESCFAGHPSVDLILSTENRGYA